MSNQEQFLDVIDRDEAARRFHAALLPCALGPEDVPLELAWGRTLALDVLAPVDVPSFDRSNFDGYALRAQDTYGAQEESPRTVRLTGPSLAAGQTPTTAVEPGCAVPIATGAMLPRGADAVLMVEHAEAVSGQLLIRRAVSPGAGVSFAGTDVADGETVLRRGEMLTSRETGVLAALGCRQVAVWRRPRVAVLSTGNELIAPGETMQPGLVYDSNSRIVADAVRELGGQPIPYGIVRDDLDELRRRVALALDQTDLVILSGGTSKGEGDLCYRAVAELRGPGIVVHGVALKPGKPLCLAVTQGKAVVILPGFPTSAIFTFHEFVAPVLRILAGRSPEQRATRQARLAVKVHSQIGRTEYVLVGLVPSGDRADAMLAAYPLGKGSGSVTTFSRADGFVAIGRHEEIVEAGTVVEVQMLADSLRPADLVAIGSHCLGLDYLLGRLQDLGFRTKFLAVGSTGGLYAARRGECDVAGMHLLDRATGVYNRPFLTAELELLEGYGRQQGVVFRPDDRRFANVDAVAAITAASGLPGCQMVNRTQGSGTRILLDQLLGGQQPPGYGVQASSHNAVAAAVAQGRADWGVAIEHAARRRQLGFLPLQAEHYDFAVPRSRLNRPAVQALQELLLRPDVRQQLAQLGCMVRADS
ncbi:MAG: molybdopterin biosynthesis protein [Pirellulales bacterium]